MFIPRTSSFSHVLQGSKFMTVMETRTRIREGGSYSKRWKKTFFFFFLKLHPALWSQSWSHLRHCVVGAMAYETVLKDWRNFNRFLPKPHKHNFSGDLYANFNSHAKALATAGKSFSQPCVPDNTQIPPSDSPEPFIFPHFFLLFGTNS